MFERRRRSASGGGEGAERAGSPHDDGAFCARRAREDNTATNTAGTPGSAEEAPTDPRRRCRSVQAHLAHGIDGGCCHTISPVADACHHRCATQ
jgi:hypothetical protein